MEELSPIRGEKHAFRIKLQAATRCARAALLLSSLKTSPDPPSSTQVVRLKNGEAEEELKRELVKARMKNKKMRFCSGMEFCLQIGILFSLWTLCLLLTFVLFNSF